MADKKCVYITGGSSGMGLGLARLYAARGDDVVILARGSGEQLNDVVQSCRALATDPAQTIVAECLDVTAFDTLQ